MLCTRPLEGLHWPTPQPRMVGLAVCTDWGDAEEEIVYGQCLIRHVVEPSRGRLDAVLEYLLFRCKFFTAGSKEG
jgi:hypothetical protein